MAANLEPNAGEVGELHEINVTPFIDVMLVLLIIFMVAAPLATVDIAVDLPASNAKPQPRPEKPLYLTVKTDLSVSVGDQPVSRTLLPTALETSTKGDKGTRIFVRADKLVPFGELMDFMNVLRAAGYLKISLVGLEQVSSP